jgi:hypothetical protein
MKPGPAPAALETGGVDDRPLGRALVDEIDTGDELDVIPSYGPKKVPAAPAKSPPPPPSRRQAPAKSPPAKPHAAPAEAKRGRGGPPRGRNAAPASRRKPADEPPPTAKPHARPVADDEDFGAGLD